MLIEARDVGKVSHALRTEERAGVVEIDGVLFILVTFCSELVDLGFICSAGAITGFEMD